MTSPEQATRVPPPGADLPSVADLQVIAGLQCGKDIDVERLFDKQLDHRHAMDRRAWRYRLACLGSGLAVFAFLGWFAVRLAGQGATLEAVGIVGFGGLPMVALFVTGEVVSRRMLK